MTLVSRVWDRAGLGRGGEGGGRRHGGGHLGCGLDWVGSGGGGYRLWVRPPVDLPSVAGTASGRGSAFTAPGFGLYRACLTRPVGAGWGLWDDAADVG